MKKYIIVIMVSLMCGGLFMFYFFKKEESFNDVYAFQVGFYEKYNNALSFSKTLPSSVIIPDKNGYYVIVAMYEDIDVINKMLMYYGEKDLDIIIKKIKCDNNFMNELNKYENVVNKIDNKSLYDEVNQNILNLYLETV